MITEYLHMNGIYAWELKKVKEGEMVVDIYEQLLDLRTFIFRGTSSAGQFSANWKEKRTESFKNLVKGRLTRTDTRWRVFPVIQCPSNCGALTD